MPPAPIEATKSLLRTAVRTFHPLPKTIFLFDALLTYGVLHVDDMVPLFPPNTIQPKEIRALLTPLKNSRLVSVGTRTEIREGHTRSMQREYYHINYHEAVDAIKYRIVKLQDKVQDLYKQAEGQRKDWSCPRCHAEYDELSILDKIAPTGFYCERCGMTLEQNEQAILERGEHTKIRALNDQLGPFNKLLAVIDSGEVPENAFEDAWARKRPVPEQTQLLGSAHKPKWMEVSQQRNQEQRKQQATVDASAVGVSISTEKEQEERVAAEKREKQRAAAAANVLPDWYQNSTVGAVSSAVKKEEGGTSPNPLAMLKKEEEDEKKPVLSGAAAEQRNMQEDLDEYVREMERERLEQERREAQAAAEEDEDEDDEEEEDFEDAVPSGVNTPMSSQQPSIKQESTPTISRLIGNGLKRELDLDGDSVSGTDTGANTPAYAAPSSAPDAKRIKLENGIVSTKLADDQVASPAVVTNGATPQADSEEEDDFEDV